MSEINRDLWLQAVADTLGPIDNDPNLLTSTEFAAIQKCGRTRANTLLIRMRDEGKVVAAQKWVLDSSSRRQLVPAWRLVTPPAPVKTKQIATRKRA